MPAKVEKVVSVVAGGWSFTRVNPAKLPGIVIGVNDSGLLLENVQHIVTMDRLWTEHRWQRVLDKHGTRFHVRKNALQNIKGWETYPFVRPFTNSDKAIAKDYTDPKFVPFSGKVGELEGNNSAVCALNLAYQLLPTQLYLFGFDMCRGPNGEPYWYPPYDWAPAGATKDAKYKAWANQFSHIAEHFDVIGCEVFNVSGRSRIRAFNQYKPQQLGMEK